MTDQKTLKRRVRARMAKTGERYTTARHQLLTRADRRVASQPLAAPDGLTADTRVRERTGRGWTEWLAIIRASDVADAPHRDIATWLRNRHAVPGWWAQQLTLGYEIATGRRMPNQRGDGFAATAAKTVAAPVDRLYAAFVDDATRQRWLPDLALTLRSTSAPKSASFVMGDGTRLTVGFTAKGDRSSVGLEHGRLPDAASAESMKAYWRERVKALAELLAG